MKMDRLNELKHEFILGHRCKSGIVIFAWMVTWYYAYSPFNKYTFAFGLLRHVNHLYFTSSSCFPCAFSYLIYFYQFFPYTPLELKVL